MLRCITFFLKMLQMYDYTLQICETETDMPCLWNGVT